MRKLIVRLALLAFVIIAINQIVLLLLPFGWAAPIARDKLSYLRQYGDDYNTLYLGSSRFYRHIDPAIIDDDSYYALGTKSFNVGIAAYYLPDSMQIYRQILKTPRPNLKYVLVELAPPQTKLAGKNMHTSLVISRYSIRSTFLMLDILLREDLSYKELFRYSARHLISFAEREFNIGLGPEIIEFVFSSEAADFGELRRTSGYVPLDVDNGEDVLLRRESFERNKNEIEKNYAVTQVSYRDGQLTTTYNRLLMEMVEEMIRLSDENGIQIVFVLGPRMYDKYALMLPIYNRLPAENRVSIADPDKYAVLYSEEVSYDVGHMNKAGADLFSTLLKEKLVSILAKPNESYSE